VAVLAAACADGPPAEVTVVSATDVGTLETAAGIRGRDGGYSGVFAGRSIWLYGDTILDAPAADGSSWRHNSWSWTEDADASDGITGFQQRVDGAGAPTELFPLTAVEQEFNDAHFLEPCTAEPCGARWALWPGQIVADPARDRALVFYSKIYAEPGDFNFHGVGSSFAVWDRFEDQPTRPVFDPGAEHPTLMFPDGQPGFGSAALVVDELLYVYACGLDGLGKPCRLARVPLADVLGRGAWRFYAGGDGWVADVDRAASVFDGNDIMTVAHNPYLDRYTALYAEPLTTRVSMRTAPSPAGPWSRAVELFEARAPEGDGWTYDALAHPEFEQDGGRVQYVTYSRATGFLESEVRVVRVELAAE